MASMRKRYDGDLEAGEALLPDADDDELRNLTSRPRASELPRAKR